MQTPENQVLGLLGGPPEPARRLRNRAAVEVQRDRHPARWKQLRQAVLDAAGDLVRGGVALRAGVRAGVSRTVSRSSIDSSRRRQSRRISATVAP